MEISWTFGTVHGITLTINQFRSEHTANDMYVRKPASSWYFTILDSDLLSLGCIDVCGFAHSSRNGWHAKTFLWRLKIFKRSGFYLPMVALVNNGQQQFGHARLPNATVLTDTTNAAVSDLFNLIFLFEFHSDCSELYVCGKERTTKVKCKKHAS